MNPVSVSNLEKSVHAVLRQWHHASPAVSPLDALCLYQQALIETGNVRQATNQVILGALNLMGHDHREHAQLLRLRFLDQMTMAMVANQLNVAEGTAYKRQKEAIGYLATQLYELEQQTRQQNQAGLEQRLNLPVGTPLFGVTPFLDDLLSIATQPRPPWLISIEGLGGIGKTALANALVREISLLSQFQRIGWVSAKPHDFHPTLSMDVLKSQPTVSLDKVIATLLEQLSPGEALPTSPQDRLAALHRLLKSNSYFIIIDNLETVADHQALVPTLAKLANPSCFVLTSRHSLHAYPDVYCLTVPPLSLDDAVALLRNEADLRRIPALATAPAEQLTSIYDVVGGNPLALKLVAGQMRLLPLTHILANLQQTRGKPIEALYTFIYWQSWHLLDQTAQQTLLAMPVAGPRGSTLDYLATVSGLSVAALSAIINELISRSLLEVNGTLDDRRYAIHRLTETFLLTEVAQWS